MVRKLFFVWLFLTLIGPAWTLLWNKVDLSLDWRTAPRDSTGLAPDAASTEEAVIQAYAARAFHWRGIFATHCWLAVKPRGAKSYTVYQVVGWRAWQGLPALSVEQDIPDRLWYGAKPEVILDLRGEKAQTLIPRIAEAVDAYAYAAPYSVWPGPNSNTMPAFVARAVPELGLVLPASAIGKDYLGPASFFAAAPSGTGYQVSLWGALGLLVAGREGIEINILGGVYGVGFSPFSIKLPGF